MNTLIKKTQVRKKLPFGRSLGDFEQLHPAEKKLLQECNRNEPLSSSQSCPQDQTDSNVVRASFVRFLILGGDSQAPVKEKGVELQSVYIVGKLNLEGDSVDSNIKFENCRFETGIGLMDAKIGGTIIFDGCYIPEIFGPRIECMGSVLIVRAKVLGLVSLNGAKIGGGIECNGDFGGFSAIGSKVFSDVSFSGGFNALGTVALMRSEIGGLLNFRGATLNGKESLLAEDIVVGRNVLFDENFRSKGIINLHSASIGGNLQADGGNFGGDGGDCLLADRINVKGGVFFRYGFKSFGRMVFFNAVIRGGMNFRGANLKVKQGNSLVADRADIGGDVSFSEGFSSEGCVRIVATIIGKNLDCQAGKFTSLEISAFDASDSIVGRNVFLINKFEAFGKVSFYNAKVAGSFDCTGSFIDYSKESKLLTTKPKVTNFLAAKMVVEGSFKFLNMIQPVNGMSLYLTKVGGFIDDIDSWGDDLVLEGFEYQILTGGASTAAKDRIVWLDKQRVIKDTNSSDEVRFFPQPWRQLRKVLSENGHSGEAIKIAIEFENRQRLHGKIGNSMESGPLFLRWLYKAFCMFVHRLFNYLMGYGYRPMKLVGWTIGCWFVCSIIYWNAAVKGVFAPTNPLVFQNDQYAKCMPSYLLAKPEIKKQIDSEKQEKLQKPTASGPATQTSLVTAAPVQGIGNWYLCELLPEEYTGFSPLAYSLDLILPLVDLQQEKDWAPLIPTPSENWFKELFSFSHKHFVRVVVWFEILFGWLASLMFVAYVSGLMKKDDS